jgi:cellulose synthase/poly-beta-1,6-N-acetylglucosamine synthase-like glycosyltransferase
MSRSRPVSSAAFALCAGGAGWVLAGYPLALLALPARPWRRDPDATPSMSILIPAFRERDALRRKLEALEELDYPRERLQVIVLADEDPELPRIARAARPDALVLFEPERGGKAAGLNRGLAHATGDVVVMTDANNLLEPGSLRAAARHFADPSVWAVAGRRGEDGSAYDRYEDLLRRLETRSGSVAAMSGEFMAARRERVPPFAEGIVNDDFWLLSQIVCAGGRVVYDPDAASTEPPVSLRGEIGRRSRMGAGRVAALRDVRGLPLAFAWRALSHKHGRLALPFLLLGILATSARLRHRAPFRALLGLQLAFYGAGALAAAGAAPAGPAGRVVRVAGQFTIGNVAVAMGVLRTLRGAQDIRWQPVR